MSCFCERVGPVACLRFSPFKRNNQPTPSASFHSSPKLSYYGSNKHCINPLNNTPPPPSEIIHFLSSHPLTNCY